VTDTLRPRELPVGDEDGRPIELSVVLPCLNEAETLATCIRKAKASLASLGVVGEVVVADNGSDDGSQGIARAEGARVVDVPIRGYGAALNQGFRAARGTFVIMADADDSYALDDLGPFLEALRGGADLVMGNRFAGGIAPGAMPALHRYLGNPVLSMLGRLFFKIPVGDFHCGMRGFRRDRMLDLGLRTTGMELASEMVVRASLQRLVISEVPTTLRPDGRSRRPHLRTWRDGWRHLRFLLAFSPRWLLWYPALVLGVLGTFGLLWLLPGNHRVGGIAFGIHTMLAAATAIVVAVQLGGLAVLSRAYASALGLLPRPGPLAQGAEQVLLGWGAAIGAVLTVGGLGCFVAALVGWGEASFGQLDPAATMRLPIVGMVLILVGVESVLLSFTLSLTRIDEL
jgi:glycosyltransferase involved in cell wall biosynthesis